MAEATLTDANCDCSSRAPSAELVRCDETLAACTALGTQTGTALDLAGLLVEFAHPHFLLDTASLDQLAKTANGFLGRFLIA
jgi:hypothetical protein